MQDDTRPPDVAPPDVSVVVPVHGDRGELRTTLAHLAAQKTSRTFEVVVVDNGDNGDLSSLTPEITGLSLTVVTEEQRGSYAARNHGVAVSRGAVLAFTDADCRPRPLWLARAVDALEGSEAPCFVGGAVQMVASDPRRLSLAEVWQFGNDLRQDFYVQELGWAVTANLVVRREDFDRVGHFAASLASSGDREWGVRASQTGLLPLYAADAVVDHPTRPTMGALLAKMRRVARGGVALERASGNPVHAQGVLHTIARPPLRSTWRRAVRLVDRPVDRARLVPATALVHYYRLSYEVYYRATSRREAARA